MSINNLKKSKIILTTCHNLKVQNLSSRDCINYDKAVTRKKKVSQNSNNNI